MKTESARKKSVAERDLRDVVIGNADGGAQTGNAVRPHIDVVSGIADDRRVPRRARGRVNADDLFHRLREKPVRVIVPYVAFFGIRYVLNIAECFYFVSAYARFFKTLGVKRNVVFAIIDDVPEFFQLQFFQFAARHRLDILLKKHILFSLGDHSFSLRELFA